MAAGMPSLSTIVTADPWLAEASNAFAPNVSAPPAATGNITGTDASQTPFCALPDVLDAVTPFTLTDVTPKTSTACTLTRTGELANTSSVPGDRMMTDGGVTSCTTNARSTDA